MRYNDYQCKACRSVKRLPAKTSRKIHPCRVCDAIQSFERVDVADARQTDPRPEVSE